MLRKARANPGLWLAGIVIILWIAGSIMAQVVVSGSPSVTISNATLAVTQSGNWSVRAQDGAGNLLTSTAQALDINIKTGSIANTAFALNAGSAIVGYARLMPPGCSTLSSDVVHDTVGVATGAGTSVSSVTGCIEKAYVTNITNATVTFRLADKTGTPIIWLGGNADFGILANSAVQLPGIEGITFANGITAIAGTASALNLHIVTRE